MKRQPKTAPDPVAEVVSLLVEHTDRGRVWDALIERKEGERFVKLKYQETRFGDSRRGRKGGNSTVTVTVHHWWGDER